MKLAHLSWFFLADSLMGNHLFRFLYMLAVAATCGLALCACLELASIKRDPVGITDRLANLGEAIETAPLLLFLLLPIAVVFLYAVAQSATAFFHCLGSSKPR